MRSYKQIVRADLLLSAFALRSLPLPVAGDFQKAVEYQKRAMNMKCATVEDRANMQIRLALYERQQPFREGLEQ